MGDPRQEMLFGRIAVHLKMITMDQLSAATQLQGTEKEPQIGDILLEKGWVTPEQIRQIVAYQKDYIARRQQTGAAGPAGSPTAGPAPAPGAAPGAAAAKAAAAPGASAPARPAVPGKSAVPGKPAATTGAPVAAAAKAPAGKAATAPRAARPAGASTTQPNPTAGRLDVLLTRAVQEKASDLHLHSGAPLKMRIHGNFVDDGATPLSTAEIESMLMEIMTDDQRKRFTENGELDFAYTMPGVGRFRANAYRQHRGVDGVFRVIPPAPPSLEDLGLPASLAKVVNFHQGLVLLTGPTGCGKSSTMAALIDILNEERRDHILTVEDPIEHLHPSKRCVVNQRQVSRHTESFPRALRAALREDPDVIVIGELRDRETISLALTAAETGHLVLGTLHTNSAIRTINRILGVFPPNQQSQIRTMISESLKAIVSQRLITRADGKGRVSALEVLMCNRAIGNLIREGKTFQILSVLQTGAPHGMCLMENSLGTLVKSGAISRDEALKHCEDPKRLAA